MLRFLRVLRLAKLENYMDENFGARLSLRNQTIRFMKFLMWVVVLLHLISCVWFMVAVFDDFDVETWVFRRHCPGIRLAFPYLYNQYNVTLVEFDQMSSDCADRVYDMPWTMYLDGVYFAFTTMATIGNYNLCIHVYLFTFILIFLPIDKTYLPFH